MSKPDVLVTRRLPGNALERLAQVARLQVWPKDERMPAETLREQVGDVDALLCVITDRIDRALLDAAPKLRVVSTCSVGVDHVDLAALAARKIPLGHTPHVLTDATADLTFALLLSAARRLPEAEALVRGGHWTPNRAWGPEMLLGKDLRGATLGLIGLGPVGIGVAQRAQGFGLRVIGWTPSGRAVAGVESASFEQVLEQADFLSLHIALSDRTRKLIDAKALARVKHGAVLINTARGGLIDEQALIDALANGTLAAAALDVFEREPIGADHPLLQLPNVVVLPHIGSATLGTRTAMANLAVDNLICGLQRRAMPHCANASALT